MGEKERPAPSPWQSFETKIEMGRHGELRFSSTAPAADRLPWLPLASRGRGGGKEETIYRRGEEGNDSEFDSTCRHNTKQQASKQNKTKTKRKQPNATEALLSI